MIKADKLMIEAIHQIKKDGYKDIKTDYISKELFDSCIRTGYLVAVSVPCAGF